MIDLCKQCQVVLDVDEESQDAEFCAACLRERIENLEDALSRISKLCLRTPKAPIWEEICGTVGGAGEKRWT